MKILATLWLCCLLIAAAFTLHEYREIDRIWLECSTDMECLDVHRHEMFAEASNVPSP